MESRIHEEKIDLAQKAIARGELSLEQIAETLDLPLASVKELAKERMSMQESQVCPLCGQKYDAPPAISRTDNKTAICPECGTRQALRAAGISPETEEEIIIEIRSHQMAQS